MKNNNKVQEFITKMEMTCDMVYQKRPLESLEEMEIKDLEIMSNNTARALEIIKKAMLSKMIR
jgi:hypothetical protein